MKFENIIICLRLCLFSCLSSCHHLVRCFSKPAAFTAQKMKFHYFFSKCDQIRRKPQIWSHLLKKYLMENFIFCAVLTVSSMSFLLCTISSITCCFWSLFNHSIHITLSTPNVISLYFTMVSLEDFWRSSLDVKFWRGIFNSFAFSNKFNICSFIFLTLN